MKANRNVRAVMIGVGRVLSRAEVEADLEGTVVDRVPVVDRVLAARLVALVEINVDRVDSRIVVDLAVADNSAGRSRKEGVHSNVVTIIAIKGRARRRSRVNKW
jgi:hypothetical protein